MALKTQDRQQRNDALKTSLREFGFGVFASVGGFSMGTNLCLKVWLSVERTNDLFKTAMHYPEWFSTVYYIASPENLLAIMGLYCYFLAFQGAVKTVDSWREIYTILKRN